MSTPVETGTPVELRTVADTEARGERLAAGLGAGDLVVLSGPLGAGGPLGLFCPLGGLSGVLLLLAFFAHGVSSCPLVGLIAGYPFGRNPKAASAAEGAQAGRLAFRGPAPRGVVRP